jgi:two-component system nitrogen regulation sensor histidine kinase NtrY
LPPCNYASDPRCAVDAERTHRLTNIEPKPAAALRLDERRSTGRFGPITVAASLLLALATFFIFAGLTPITPTNEVVWTLLASDAAVILVLLVLIALEARKLIAERRAGRAGARLHSRVVTLFSLVAAVPALVTAVVATVSLERVIKPAFMQDIGAFIDQTGRADQLYRESQCRSLLRDVEISAADLSQSASLLQSNQALFTQYLTSRAKTLGFDVAAIMKGDGSVQQTAAGSDPKLLAIPDPRDFSDAVNGEALCGLLREGDEFIGLRPLAGVPDTFLYAGRAVDPFARQFATQAADVARTYTAFTTHRRNIERGFAVVFILLALTMLFSAVWLGLTFANQLVAPIRRLIRATDEVASGNLYVQVPTRRSEGDLGHLGDTFNKMTLELRQQQNRLIAAHSLNDERRVFTEAVLSAVPAGVVGVDANGTITVANMAAEQLLAFAGSGQSLVGQQLNLMAPDIAPLLLEARMTRLKQVQGQARMQRDGRERILNVRVTGNPQQAGQTSVVTLDDITDLVSAQRTAAWADVARRIAHEIKNPLTPIQLSAERLKRRFGRLIVEGRDVFDQCTDTIIRQVDDIKRMVDEFSSFARMPRARPQRDDLTDCVRQTLFLMRVGRSEIAIEDDLPEAPVFASFDRRLIAQALTNVIKNAGEGIDALEGGGKGQGRIVVSLRVDDDRIARLSVSDNGKGFPASDRDKLIEPYVTTRAEGTGLGLPIVIKILEDHGGIVGLLDGLERPDGGRGAQVMMSLPAVDAPAASELSPAQSASERALSN